MIGLTAPFKHFYELLGWDVLDAEEVLPPLLHELEDEADIIVLLSHLGYWTDVSLAEAFPDIDVILGAHTHHVLPEGERVGDTLICQGGKHGKYVGQTTLTIEGGCLIHSEDQLHQATNKPKDRQAVALLEELHATAEEDLHVPIGTLDQPLTHNWFSPSNFSMMLAKALRQWCKADIGMVNAGLLLQSLPAGAVTEKDIHEACPHPINPCLVTLTGAQLREIVKDASTEEKIHLRFKGLGFRGTLMGIMVYDGLQTSTTSDTGRETMTITVHGKPLEPDRLYRIGTVDMFTFGSLYPQLVRLPNKTYFVPEMLRDLIAWALSKPSPV
ncbi:bifunctional metallophosphatase/5'-nucleotidase [Bacillaceae bacterium SIJ1]|uniref:bifunctional metallophosphatase/5'-nucleotidase n=1 Tax=Litoribacterium kuwaitense TaxID=1398745 RepID=UPI0013EAAE50|nr:5'-nucleotidase C-terminal domain-containing protein [Litoribacterium kuwaitense]NGP46175.1 bifunctional metallophosphatase/5'-nucleotidase [Litoribacterium kuwaitense]